MTSSVSREAGTFTLSYLKQITKLSFCNIYLLTQLIVANYFAQLLTLSSCCNHGNYIPEIGKFR